jgi:putative membrane protein
VAVTKAVHAKVKEFAELEAAEQETVSDVLAMLQAPDQASGQIKVPSDDEVLAKLGPDDKAALDKLKGLSGKAFDAAYIKAEVDGHNKLLGIQQTYLSVGKNPENLAVAKLASGVIKEHLKHLASLPAAL